MPANNSNNSKPIPTRTQGRNTSSSSTANAAQPAPHDSSNNNSNSAATESIFSPGTSPRFPATQYGSPTVPQIPLPASMLTNNPNSSNSHNTSNVPNQNQQHHPSSSSSSTAASPYGTPRHINQQLSQPSSQQQHLFPPNTVTTGTSPNSYSNRPLILSSNSHTSELSGASSSTSNTLNLTEAQKADIVRKHLLTASEQQSAASSSSASIASSLSGVNNSNNNNKNQKSSKSVSGSTTTTGPGASGITLMANRSEGGGSSQITTRTATGASDREEGVGVGGGGSGSAIPFPGAFGDVNEEYPTPYALPGGDIVAPIYKWAQQQAQKQQQQQHQPQPQQEGDDGTLSTSIGAHLSGFGGMRRSKSFDTLPGTADSRRVSTAYSGPGDTSLTSSDGPGDVDAEHHQHHQHQHNHSRVGTTEEHGQEDTFEALEYKSSSMRVREILEPGGFRRDFVIRKMASRGEDILDNNNNNNNNNHNNSSSVSRVGVMNGYGSDGGMSSIAEPIEYTRSGKIPIKGRFTRSFVDFLSLYGHFGGEDLEEIDEEEEDDNEILDEEDELEYEEGDEHYIPPYRGGVSKQKDQLQSREVTSKRLLPGSGVLADERTPLVKRSQSVRGRGVGGGGSGGVHENAHGASGGDARPAARRRSSSGVGQHGDATVTQAVMMLLKSFVGTGVLFLGKAFFNGGMLFSTIVLCVIAMVSLYSFLLLVETRLIVHGSFGDIGGMLYGKYMRWAILFSIVLSQIGFVSAYTIFVAQNLQAFFMAVTNCRTLIKIPFLILGQLLLFLPLAMIRNIQKLSGTALIADAFILFGLVYIFSNEIKVLADNGLADIQLFNGKDFPLLIGTAVFSFEGIGLVIPITESMKDPHQFPRVLTGVMVGVMILFAGGGILAYAAYGSNIQTVVFVNLPQEDRFVNAAQFLYSIAILLSTPLQLFPAVRIMENGLFSNQKSGKHSNKVKWEKNLFRTFVVVACSVVAWVGASDLDKFVSLIGSVACVPLCFCYPALLHYKACAVTRKQKIADILLLLFGLLAAIYTTSQTIILLTSGESSAPPTFGKCPPRD